MSFFKTFVFAASPIILGLSSPAFAETVATDSLSVNKETTVIFACPHKQQQIVFAKYPV